MTLGMTERRLGPRRALLSVVGGITAATAGELKARIKGLASSGTAEIVVDLAGVGFMDSSGLAALVAGLKAAREAGGWLRIAGVIPAVRSIFSVTLLDRVFEIHPDAESAAR